MADPKQNVPVEGLARQTFPHAAHVPVHVDVSEVVLGCSVTTRRVTAGCTGRWAYLGSSSCLLGCAYYSATASADRAPARRLLETRIRNPLVVADDVVEIARSGERSEQRAACIVDVKSCSVPSVWPVVTGARSVE